MRSPGEKNTSSKTNRRTRNESRRGEERRKVN